MTVEVVDGDERQAPRPRDRLGGREADEQRAHEPRALRHADAVDVREAEPGIVERRANDGRDQLEVASRRDLGHDAAEPRVQVRLRGDDRREQLALPRDDGRGGLVA